MKRFKKPLLVVAEGEDIRATLETAVMLAKKNRGTLSILEVIEPMRGPKEMHTGMKAIQDTLLEHRLKALRTLAEPHCNDGFNIPIAVTIGSPCVETTRQVIRENHDLVLCNSREQQGHHEAIRLMRTCPCPVWGVKSRSPGQYECILACIDPDPRHTNHHPLNDIILELAIAQAEAENAALHILHGYHVIEKSVIPGTAKLADFEIKEHTQVMAELHRKSVDNLLDHYDFSRIGRSVHVLEGRPSELIPHWAKEHAVDLIIMGTVCRTGLAGFLMGNTAESVLRHVDCSVLTVKPLDFETPVKLIQDGNRSVSDVVRGLQQA